MSLGCSAQVDENIDVQTLSDNNVLVVRLRRFSTKYVEDTTMTSHPSRT